MSVPPPPKEIASGAAPELLSSVWRHHEGTWCRGVNWERLSLGELQQVARWGQSRSTEAGEGGARV